jgi:hypothetical protein
VVQYSDRGFVWVPRPSYVVSGSVLINGAEYKSDVLSCTIDGAVTDSCGTCEIRIYNQYGQYTGLISKTNSIKIYADYDTGTTQIFDGYVRDINYSLEPYSILTIKGNDWAGQALLQTVNKQYTTPSTIDTIFKDLISSYLTDHTTNNVADLTSLGTFAPTFNNKTLLDCLKDLMALTDNNYCFYCDFSKDWHMFEKGSIFNLYEPILYSRNLIRLGTEDTLADIETKITLYGQDQEGFPMCVTVSDDPEGVGVIHTVYKDTNVTTYDALVEKATEILNSKKSGEIKVKQAIVKGMISLRPGDTVYVFAPQQSLQGEMFVSHYTHNIIGRKTIRTTCTLQVQRKFVENLATIIKDRIDENQELLAISNENDLENSYNFTFNDNSNMGTMTHTEISGGKLQLTSGYSTGTALSAVRTTIANVTKVEVKYSGWNMTDSTIEVSVNGGLNYQTLTANTVTNVSYSGSSLMFKITLNSTAANPGPNLDSLVLLYT